LSNVVDLKVQTRLIQEAREARAKRKAERESDSWAERHKPEHPDDDMEIGS
jgi:hypothetical protein